MTSVDGSPSSLTFVATGSFGPGSFHPDWIAELGLVGKVEAAAAKRAGASMVVSPEVAQFEIGGITFLVVPERVQISAQREDLFEPSRDLFSGLMRALGLIRVTALGINWIHHTKALTERSWHAFGDTVAPKAFWNQMWKGRPGLLDLRMQLEREDDLPGSLNINVQPSSLIRPGVYMNLNDHYPFSPPISAEDCGDSVLDVYPRSKAAFDRIIGGIVKEVRSV